MPYYQHNNLTKNASYSTAHHSVKSLQQHEGPSCQELHPPTQKSCLSWPQKKTATQTHTLVVRKGSRTHPWEEFPGN